LQNRFLFGLWPDPAPDPLHFHSTTSQQAYKNTMSLAAPIGLSHRADQYWSHHSPHLPFGHTYHAWFPTNWIRQTGTPCLVPTSTKHLPTSHLFKSLHKKYTIWCSHSHQLQSAPYNDTIWLAFRIDPPCLLLRARLNQWSWCSGAHCTHPHPLSPIHSDDALNTYSFLDITHKDNKRSCSMMCIFNTEFNLY
jgi:hypothetical protein